MHEIKFVFIGASAEVNAVGEEKLQEVEDNLFQCRSFWFINNDDKFFVNYDKLCFAVVKKQPDSKVNRIKIS